MRKRPTAGKSKAVRKAARSEEPVDGAVELRQHVRRLLVDLVALQEAHPEVGENPTREALSEMMEAFVLGQPGYRVPRNLFMLTAKGNQLLRAAVSRFVKDAGTSAKAAGMSAAQRIGIVRALDVTVDGQDLEDYFGGMNFTLR